MASNVNPFLQSPYQAIIDKQDDEDAKPLIGSQAVKDSPLPTVPAAKDEEDDAPDAPAPAPTQSLLPPPALRPLFEATASHFKVPVNVLMAMAAQESSYNPKAENAETGARGVAGYMKDTANTLRINRDDPNEAIPAAAMQLRERLDKGYSMEDAIKEHFAGTNRKLWGPKTAVYGQEVLSKAGQIGQELYGDDQSAAPADAAPSAPDTDTAQNQFAPTRMRRDDYLAEFKKLNPKASQAAIDSVMGQYDAQVAAAGAARAAARTVGPKGIPTPEQFFNDRLNARLQGPANGIVPQLPGRMQPDQLQNVGTPDEPAPQPDMLDTIGGNAIGGMLSTIVGAVAANAHLVGADDVAKDWSQGLEQIKGRQKELGGDTFAGKTASLVGGIVPAMVAAPESKVVEFVQNSGLFGVPAFQDTYKQKLAEGQSNKLALVHAFEAFGMNTLAPTIMQRGTGAIVGKLASEGAAGVKGAVLGLGQAAGEGVGFSAANSVMDKGTDVLAGQQNDRPWLDPQDMAVQAAGFGAIRGAHMATHAVGSVLPDTVQDANPAGPLTASLDDAVTKAASLKAQGASVLDQLKAIRPLDEQPAGPLDAAMQDAATQHAANPAPMPEQPAEAPQAPQPPDLTQVPIDQLRVQLKQVAQDAARNPEQRQALTAEQKRIRDEIKARGDAAMENSKPAAEPLSAGPFDDMNAANKMMQRYATETGQPHEVVAQGDKFAVKPIGEVGNGIDAAGNGGIPDGRGRSSGPAAGVGSDQRAAGSGTEHGAGAGGLGELSGTPGVSVPHAVDHPATANGTSVEPAAVDRLNELKNKLQPQADRLTDMRNEAVRKFNAAKQNGNIKAMESLKTQIDGYDAKRRQIGHILFTEGQKIAAAQRAAENAKTFGAMDIGTKIGMIGYEAHDDTYFQKVAPNKWQRTMGGETSDHFKTDAQMEGGRVIPSKEATADVPERPQVPEEAQAQAGEKAAPAAEAPAAGKAVTTLKTAREKHARQEEAIQKAAANIAARKAEKESNHGVAGENAPGARESLEHTLVNAPDVSGKNGSFKPPAWTEMPNGFAHRQYVAHDTAIQEIRAPKTGSVEPPILRRGLTADGKTYGEREGTGTFGDIASGKAFDAFSEYFKPQEAKPRLESKPSPQPVAAEAPAPTHRLDHGELNIPGRLKNIDAELDKYKAQQEKAANAERKTKAQQNREDKARAKELFADVGDALLDKHGDKFGRKKLANELDQMVKWEPAKFIKLAEKFKQEQEAVATPAVEESAPAKPKAKPATTGGQRARDRVKAENPFMAFLGRHGVHIDERSDTGGQQGRAGMVMIPGYGSLYRHSGQRIDELAGLAHEAGFLSDHDMADPTDNGGTRKLADMIQRAAHNKEVIQPAVAVEKSAPDAEQLLHEEADRLGIDTRGKSTDEVYDAVVAHHAAQFDDEQAHAAVEMAQDADIPLGLDDSRASSHDLTDEDLDAIFGTASRDRGQDEGHTGQPADASAEETGRARKSAASAEGSDHAEPGNGRSGQADDGFLTHYSADDIRAQEAANDERARAESADAARADRAARDEQNRKEVNARMDASAEHFQLGQSADDSLSGQHTLLDIKDREEGDRRAASRGPDDRRTIEVDGQRHPIRDASGRLIAGGDFMKQMEFWRNFDGKVDEHGHPILDASDPRAVYDVGSLMRDNRAITQPPRTAEDGRGAEQVKSELRRSRDAGEIDPATANFALWALDKSPSLARDLRVNVQDADERGVAGSYQPAKQVINLFRGNENPGTAMHEILHHSERMMPAAIQGEILKAWRSAYDKAYAEGDAAIRTALEDMRSMATDRDAASRVIAAFRDGTLKYGEHYQLSNPSEYWAVNATRLMGERHAADSWVAKAKNWLTELGQRVRGWLGLPSDAPILKALDSVLKGTGKQLSPKMLVEQMDGNAPELRDIDDSYRDEHTSPGREDGAPLSDLTGEGRIYPDDVYSANGPRYYGTGHSHDSAAFRLAKMARGNPDFDVMVYRAVPKDINAEINPGDWVSITRQYAEDHGESRFDGEYKILSKMVKAGDIFTNGDSIQEWGYHPEEPTLRDITAPREGDPEQPEVPDSARAKLAQLIGRPVAGLRSAAHEAKMLVAPMTAGSSQGMAWAKDFANSNRRAQEQWKAMDTVLRSNFNDAELRKMWEAADQENDLRRDGKTAPDKGLNALPKDQREVVELLHAYGEQLWQRAKNAGLVDPDAEGVAYWTPRMAANIYADGNTEALRPRAGEFSKDAKNLRTSANSTKHRKYETTAESEEALKAKLGDDAAYVKNIRVMPLAMAQLEKAIAGRTLVNQIKAHGQVAGAELVNTEGGKDFQTFDHPALKNFRPIRDWQAADMDKITRRGYEVRADGVYENGEKLKSYRVKDGEVQQELPVLDSEGKPRMESVPLFVHKDFIGPLKAVLQSQLVNQSVENTYRGLMAMKGASMSVIMASPMTHNAVIWGKAMPSMMSSMGWKNNLKNIGTAGGYTYYMGHQWRQDRALMNDLIDGGLVPMGGRGMNPDIEAIGNGLKPGRSLLAKALGSVLDIASPKAGEVARKGVDAAGHFWHETLLWNRIGDMQVGMAVQLRNHLMDQGVDQYIATRVATHFANRYAGAIPQEAMSQGAHALLNTLLFSKSFTGTNLGAMKDPIAGLPKDVQAQIREHFAGLNRALGMNDIEAYDAAGKKVSEAQGIARKKAGTILLADFGAMAVITSITQAYFNGQNGQQFLDDLKKRASKLGAKLDKDNPLSFLGDNMKVIQRAAGVLRHPLDSLESLSQTSDNPHGKQDRIRIGQDAHGNSYYLRLPVGKVAEEMKSYTNLSSASVLIEGKASPLAKGVAESWNNKDFYGRSIYDKDGNLFKQAAQVVGHIMKSQVPFDDMVALKNLANGGKDNGDKVHLLGKDMNMDQAKLTGTATGLSVSKLTGGDAAAEMRYQYREQQQKLNDVLPDVKDAVMHGEVEKAAKMLQDAGQTPPEISRTMRNLMAPNVITKSRMNRFMQHANPDEVDRVSNMMQRQ